ncbi:MAG: phosphodiesterase [Betaproteobacteria bacterium]|nr:phosphodiesterase [Betaproteobacteria bacterium]
MAVLLVAQLSDAHIGAPGATLAKGLDTAPLLAQAVASVLRLKPLPDLVIFTGDLVESGATAEYRHFRQLIAPLAMPVFVLPGNHDSSAGLRAAFAAEGYLPDGDQLDYVIERWPLRLIMLDTIVAGAPYGELDAGQLAWLDDTLADAPARPTLIALHHPPFGSGIVHMDEMALLQPQRLEAVVARHAQVVGVTCGHLHRMMAQRFGHTLAVSAPSVAHQIALDLNEVPEPRYIMEPPGFLLHRWDGARLTTHFVASGDFGAGRVFV